MADPSGARRAIEENMLAIIDSSGIRESRDLHDDRISFLEAVRAIPILPTRRIYGAVFDIWRKDAGDLEAVMACYQILTDLTNTGLSLGFPSTTTLPPNVIPRPVDQDTIFFPTTTAAAAAVQVVGGVGDPMMMSNGGRLVESDVAGYVAPSASPGLPYVYERGTFGKKTGGAGVEKAVERRQKRMIKNRESAARSRARKQAYTTELEAEVKKLKEQNQELQRKHDLLEAEKNQAWEIVRQHQKKPPPPQSPCM